VVSGQNVVLTVEANVEADQLKLLARGVQPADVSVADAAAMGLKIFVSDEAAITSISTRLNDKNEGAPQRGRGPVHLVLSHPELPGEVEIALKGEYPMNPQIKGAIKHIAGVLDVEEF
jgi:DNA polymerase-3 subunit alpha